VRIERWELEGPYCLAARAPATCAHAVVEPSRCAGRARLRINRRASTGESVVEVTTGRAQADRPGSLGEGPAASASPRERRDACVMATDNAIDAAVGAG